MKRAETNSSGQPFRLVLLIGASVLLFVSPARGQSGSGSRAVPCMVNYLRLRIATGGDDLRGWDGFSTSKDNLDVTVYFGENGSQLAADVNNNQKWQNNSVHLVEIKLNQAVPLNQIKGIQLKHTGSGVSFDAAKGSTPLGPAAGIQSPDTWDMQWLEVTAVGGGVGATILHHGPKSFTNGDRVLSTRVQIPANSCNGGERFGRLTSGIKDVQPVGGAGSRYGKEQQAPSAIEPPRKSGNQPLPNHEIIQPPLAHTVQIGPRAGAPESPINEGGAKDTSWKSNRAIQNALSHAVLVKASGAIGGSGANEALGGMLRKQSAAARSLLVPVAKPAQAGQPGALLNGGEKAGISSQPLPLRGSVPQVGAGQTMSSSRGGSPGGTPGATAVSSNSSGGTVRRPAPGSLQSQMTPQMCAAGIAAVDGLKNGVWFSPVSGEEGQFKILGCGFGTTPGEVYLSGVQYASSPLSSPAASLGGHALYRDRVYFEIPANEWNDRLIIAQIDPNASGLYDTNNVTLNVKTASGQVYQAPGMNFIAAREDQVLTGLLKPPAVQGINLAKVADSQGEILSPIAESPSLSLVKTGESIAVMRERIMTAVPSPAYTFGGGKDVYQFHFAPGFQLDPHVLVELWHASLDKSTCQSNNGLYASTGESSWRVNYLSTYSFEVYWGEDSCWPPPPANPDDPRNRPRPASTNDMLNFASLSAYALRVTVVGPRGVNPLASGNSLEIQQLQPVQTLQKQ